jgi:hypothetical protein
VWEAKRASVSEGDHDEDDEEEENDDDGDDDCVDDLRCWCLPGSYFPGMSSDDSKAPMRQLLDAFYISFYYAGG